MAQLIDKLEHFIREIRPLLTKKKVRASHQPEVGISDTIFHALREAVQWARSMRSRNKIYKVTSM